MKTWKKGVIALLFALPFAGASYEAADVAVKLENSKFVGPQVPYYITPSANYAFKAEGKKVTLKAGTTYRVHKGGTKLYLQLNGANLHIGQNGEAFFVTAPNDYATLTLTSADKKKSTTYRGDFKFIVDAKNNTIQAYNTLDIEEYVKGVVPHEMGEYWGPKGLEALKAQAVAARSYVMAGGYNQDKPIVDTTQDQVYGGYNPLHVYSHRAVEETAGEYLTFGGKPVRAYYSSSNGGYTETNDNVWSGAKLGYLANQEDTYDADYQMKEVIEANKQFAIGQIELLHIFQKYYPNDGFIALDDVSVKEYTSGKRAKTIELTFVQQAPGTKYIVKREISATKFRELIGNGTFRSVYITKIEKEIDEENTKDIFDLKFFFEYKGFGHGVGMSQWGAYYRAQDKHTYKDILSFYYPNTQLQVVEGTASGTNTTPKTYTVVGGDTLSKIATKYSTTVAQLKAWNGLTSDTIKVGQKLVVGYTVAKPSAPVTTYKVVKGDTMAAVAKKHGIRVADIQKWNALSTTSLRIGQVLNVTEKNIASMYTTVRGDTMAAVAKKYGTTVANIQKWNGLSTTSLKIGQRLKVSAGYTPHSSAKMYTAVRGDTLSAIAKKYGTTVQNIQTWNGLRTTSLKIGQTVNVTKP